MVFSFLITVLMRFYFQCLLWVSQCMSSLGFRVSHSAIPPTSQNAYAGPAESRRTSRQHPRPDCIFIAPKLCHPWFQMGEMMGIDCID